MYSLNNKKKKRKQQKKQKKSRFKPDLASLILSENSKRVLEARYLIRNSKGEVIETPAELFMRVAQFVASAESRNRKKWIRDFYELMATRRFMPNSPTLMNAGKPKGQLSACFVLPVEDSLVSIFGALQNAALIHQSGGGTGFSFSRLRPKGSPVNSTHGIASGPVSFMRIFDVSTDTIKQGGTRRGANMGVLRVDHPDILEFIESKLDLKSITNFNISVAMTDEFMNALKRDEDFWLIDPRTKKKVRRVKASDLFNRITKAAWSCGDPGLIFIDQINRFNPTPSEGEMESTNPCGEQPLLPYESCNLGSLNLGEYSLLNENAFDWARFKLDIHLATRFLDNIIDLNTYPVKECQKITLKNRKIGLGVMGFADFLLFQGISYGSEEARRWGDRIMAFLDHEAKQASVRLAKERGIFSNWKNSRWKKIGYLPMRNATVSTVAPTGTISLIAMASSGIEPLFAGVSFRNVLDGQRLVDIHPAVAKVLTPKEIEMIIQGKVHEDEILAQKLGSAWSPSRRVSVEDHVRMQAVFQKHSDSAVSKTINLPETATVDDVARAYLLAYDLGCKGITVYRDKSRPAQVLEAPVCLDCEIE